MGLEHFSISFESGKKAYRPGEVVSGRVSWQVEAEPKSAEVSLFWHTVGRGTEDVEVVDKCSLHVSGLSTEMPFSFTLPDSPYSFSGTLISLVWAVELVLSDPDHSYMEEIIVSPILEEIKLPTIAPV
ncbi:MAG: hypothetical protein KDD53_07055 [Bdellovibrionales bacterium]|nr:hypothetical protein [Bdellovibrionales bacterium]